MNNFKSGAGNLDFGDDKENEADSEPTKNHDELAGEPESSSEQPASKQVSAQADDYPYFVRRSNVGDERDTRLEIHVRDKVTEQEAKFRSELAEHLGTSEVPKTDAREFALLDAFQHPERVAERMREEGFGILD